MKKNGMMLLYVLAGNLLLAFAVCGLIVPNRFLSGGSTGIVLILGHWLPFRFSVISVLVNGTLFLTGLVFLGRRFAMTSLCSTLVYPAILAVLESLPVQISLGNPWMAAALGGILCGTGIGMVIRAGGSTGGMDIPPCILKKLRGIPVGTSMLVLDVLIFLAQLVWSGTDGIWHSLLLILLTSFMVNLVGKEETDALLSMGASSYPATPDKKHRELLHRL